jgi:hypothetical protein
MLEYTLEQWATLCFAGAVTGQIIAMLGWGWKMFTGFESLLLMLLSWGLLMAIPMSVMLTWARYPYP